MDYIRAINCFIAYQRIRIATLSFNANILNLSVYRPSHRFHDPIVTRPHRNLPVVTVLFKSISDKHISIFRKLISCLELIIVKEKYKKFYTSTLDSLKSKTKTFLKSVAMCVVL